MFDRLFHRELVVPAARAPDAAFDDLVRVTTLSGLEAMSSRLCPVPWLRACHGDLRPGPMDPDGACIRSDCDVIGLAGMPAGAVL
jgi:hypothetical protein